MSQPPPVDDSNPDELLPVSEVFEGPQPDVCLPAPKLDGYTILSKIGEAGQGQVWAAIQESTQRKVAIKVPRFYGFGARKAFARFEREVQVVARLKHPAIARIYDSGVNKGLYYYTMEHIEGRHLDRYVAEERLSQEDILNLMGRVCLAVQYAHQNAVIHRDLKPSNILVTEDGQPHLVDFGLAKALTEDDLTVTISADEPPAGTPAYMSPEQAGGRNAEIDTRTDIYSLGVILYQLLTGAFPHNLSGSRMTVLNRIVQEPIIKPQLACPGLNKELGYILQKALAKEPQRRYASAGELARDLDNYLAGRPLLAGPDSIFYIARKYVRRHRGLVLASLGGLAMLVVGLITTSMLYWQTQTAKTEVEKALEREERLNYANTIQMVHSQLEAGKYEGIRRMLEETQPRRRGWEWGYLMKYCQRPEWAFSFGRPIDTAAVSADGRYLLVVCPQTKVISLLDGQSGAVRWERKMYGHIPGFVQADFDPFNRFVAVACGVNLMVFEIDFGGMLYESRGAGYLSCCAGPDGLYAGTFDGHIFLYDVESWQIVQTAELTDKISRLAIDAKAVHLAAISGLRTITLHDPRTLQVRAKTADSQTPYQDVEVLSDNTLAAASGCGFILEAIAGQSDIRQDAQISDHVQEVEALDVSDDAGKLITGGLDGVARIYDIQTRQLLGVLYHDSAIRNVFFLASGKIITISADGQVKRWKDAGHQTANPDITIALPDSISAWHLDYAGDGSRLAFTSWGCGQIVLADTSTGSVHRIEVPEYVEEIKQSTPQAFFRPDRAEFVMKILDSIRVYTLVPDGFTEVRRFAVPQAVYRAAMDPKGRFFGLAYQKGGALLDLDTGGRVEISPPDVSASCVAVSPDGSQMAFLEAQGNKRLAVYDTQTGRLIRMIYTDFHGQAQAAAFHPALPLVAAADSDGTIRLWDLDSGAAVAELTENGMAAVYSIHFSPDGERLIYGSHDKMLRILDWKIGVVLLDLEQTATPTSVAFSPDGSSITATNTLPSGGRIYRTIPWQE